jgi:hypothetical protein
MLAPFGIRPRDGVWEKLARWRVGERCLRMTKTEQTLMSAPNLPLFLMKDVSAIIDGLEQQSKQVNADFAGLADFYRASGSASEFECRH